MSLRLQRILTANLAGLFRRNGKLILDTKSMTRELSSEGEKSPYAAQTHIIHSQASSLIKQLSSIPSLDELVIEIGSGDGVISANMLLPSLEPVMNSYTAIDNESSLIEYSRDIHKYYPISFFAADITEEESLEKHWHHYFTLALSLNVMSCLNQELALFNINRLLERNGYYVFSWCSHEDFFNILRDVKDECRIPREWLLVPESLTDCPVLKDQQWQLAKQTNFEVDQLDVSDTCFSFEDGNAVRDFFSSSEYFVALPPLMREKVFDTFYKEYKKRCGEIVSLRTVSGIFRKV